MIALAAWSATTVALAQRNFVPPQGSESAEETATLDAYRASVMQITNDKEETWLVKILPQTRVMVDGEVEIGFLRSGLSIELDGQIDRKDTLTEPITAMEVLNEKKRPTLGLFPPDEEGDTIRPVRNAGPGRYCIKAKLAACKDGQLTVSIGGRRITGTLADDVKITFTSDDPSLAEQGDSVKVKYWFTKQSRPLPAFNRPGQAFAEEVSITLAKPLAGNSRKSRR